MRTSPGLHADNAIGGERFAPHEEFHVLAREDIVRHDAQLVIRPHALAQGVHERGLAGANRPANADAYGATHAHERNNLEWPYCWLITAMSNAGANDASASPRSILASIASTTAGTRARVATTSLWASRWPIAIRRIADEAMAATRV